MVWWAYTSDGEDYIEKICIVDFTIALFVLFISLAMYLQSFVVYYISSNFAISAEVPIEAQSYRW